MIASNLPLTLKSRAVTAVQLVRRSHGASPHEGTACEWVSAQRGQQSPADLGSERAAAQGWSTEEEISLINM